jgi:hypothetical protein
MSLNEWFCLLVFVYKDTLLRSFSNAHAAFLKNASKIHCLGVVKGFVKRRKQDWWPDCRS